jgi:hypothetical protein
MVVDGILRLKFAGANEFVDVYGGEFDPDEDGTDEEYITERLKDFEGKWLIHFVDNREDGYFLLIKLEI